MEKKPVIREVIVVEGRYDAHAVRQAVDAAVVETGGFALFKNSEMQAFIKKIAAERGVIILTDSDGAGFLIRNKLKGMLDSGTVRHAYIPQQKGREKRKKKPSAAGLLGVEGVGADAVLKALQAAGAMPRAKEQGGPPKRQITKADLYEDGLYGRENSASRREALLKALELPSFLSVSALVETLNILIDYEKYRELTEITPAEDD